jgi:acyl-CoA synthetase (AMP-forming)/AMP-acid ligase II
MSTGDAPRGDLEFGTIPRMLASAAERFGDSNAIEDGDVRITYRALLAQVDEAARALLALGVEHRDRVAVWAPNTWAWVVCALAAHSVGGVVVPINTRYRGIEAAYLLQKSGARVLFTVSGFLDTDYVKLLRESGEPVPTLLHTVVVHGVAGEGCLSWPSFLALAQEASSETLEARKARVLPTDLADVLFTSGTTGKPKGAMCTHAQNLRTFRTWSDITGLVSGDRYLIAMPFFHSFGYKAGWLSALMMVFDVSRILARIERDRVSFFPGAPAIYQSLLLHGDLAKHDLSSLRVAVTGAAVIPVQLVKDMRERLGFKSVITAYGLTETTGTVSMCSHDDDPETIANTSGKAIPGVEIIVVDGEGKPLGPNEPGEILVRGFNVMVGYFDAAEETAASIDAEGFFHTGDVGTLDERGYIRITDRLKDMYIVGGFNAYPAEIEQVMLKNGDVGEVAVVGIPDERMGEVGMAFVVPKPGKSTTCADLLAWCKENMANYKVPRRIEILTALPRNATGKVLKFELRERARV